MAPKMEIKPVLFVELENRSTFDQIDDFWNGRLVPIETLKRIIHPQFMYEGIFSLETMDLFKHILNTNESNATAVYFDI